MNIKIKKLKANAIIPEKGSIGSAGSDLFACIEEEICIPPQETAIIPTGLAMELPTGYFGAVFARSGLAAKEGLRPANCVGVCDEDYRGEYLVALHNDSLEMRVIAPGNKIAQLVVMPYLQVDFTETETLSETSRGSGGFGSTDA